MVLRRKTVTAWRGTGTNTKIAGLLGSRTLLQAPTSKNLRGLGWLSRLNLREGTPLLRGCFYPNKQWASRHMRQTDEASAKRKGGKESRQERENAKQERAGVKK